MITLYVPFHKLRVIRDELPLNPREDYDNFGHMICWHRDYNLGDAHEFEDSNEFLKQLIRDSLSANDVMDYVKNDKCDSVKLQYDYLKSEWTLNRFDSHFNRWNAEYSFDNDEILNDTDNAKECILDLLPVSSLKELADRNNVIMPLYLYEHSGITISCNHTYPYNDPWDSYQVGWIYASHNEIEKEYGNVSAETLNSIRTVLADETEVFDSYLRGDTYGFVLEVAGVETESVWGFIGDLDDVVKEMKEYVDDEYHYLFEHIGYDCMEYSADVEFEEDEENEI